MSDFKEKWETEPDKVELEYLGLKCWVLRRQGMKHLCGYVELPPESSLNDLASITWDSDLEVHGGVTFEGKLEVDDLRKYVGFDCAHAGDIVPGMRDSGDTHYSTYKSVEYVTSECKKLAEQINATLPVPVKS